MEHLGTKNTADSIATVDMVNGKTSVTMNGQQRQTATFYAPTAKGNVATTSTSGIYTTRLEAQRLQAGASAPEWVTVKQTTEFTTAANNTSKYATFTNYLGTTDICISVYFSEGGLWKAILVDMNIKESTIQLFFNQPRLNQTFKVVAMR